MLGTSFSVNEKVCKLAGRKTFQEHYIFFLGTSASLYNSFHAFVSFPGVKPGIVMLLKPVLVQNCSQIEKVLKRCRTCRS